MAHRTGNRRKPSSDRPDTTVTIIKRWTGRINWLSSGNQLHKSTIFSSNGKRTPFALSLFHKFSAFSIWFHIEIIQGPLMRYVCEHRPFHQDIHPAVLHTKLGCCLTMHVISCRCESAAGGTLGHFSLNSRRPDVSSAITINSVVFNGFLAVLFRSICYSTKWAIWVSSFPSVSTIAFCMGFHSFKAKNVHFPVNKAQTVWFVDSTFVQRLTEIWCENDIQFRHRHTCHPE